MAMRTKALLIGIQYANSRWDELDGPHHDVAKMKKFLEDGPWQYGSIRVLADKDGFRRPDRQTIIESLHWLVQGATEEHRLLLHYSGHGEQSPTSSASEPDGFDENIVPVDCPSIDGDPDDGYKGMIRDNELREILVDGLPVGCQLTAIFDCCHSGSILDLRFSYPRYLSIPWQWWNAGPAFDSPRLNRTSSDKSVSSAKRKTIPPSFIDTLPPDLDILKSPLPTPSLNTPSLLDTPTPKNPYFLPEEECFQSPLLTRLQTSVNFVRRTSLRADRLAALTSPMSSFGIEGRRPSMGLGLHGMHNTLMMEAIPGDFERTPTPHLSISAIDSWRNNISPFLDDNFLCDSPTLASPTATVSATSFKNSLLGGRTSFLQGVIRTTHRTLLQRTCYENEDIPAPFQIIRYDKPIRSRGTFHGFTGPPLPDKPMPRVSSFSACYDNQVVFEMGNGDGLLTAAFIHCMQESGHEISYGELLDKMQKFFVKKNEARSSEKFTEPPFPMLSSSFPLSLKSLVEI